LRRYLQECSRPIFDACALSCNFYGAKLLII
jgi:hypothetical protein